MTADLTYLPGAVSIGVAVLIVFTLICIVIRCIYGNQYVFRFKSAYLSSCTGSYSASLILLVYRILAFGFFLGGAGIYNWVTDVNVYGFQYFTDWNVGLIFLYFFLATIASFIGLSQNVNPQAEWSQSTELLGNVVHVVFEVAGATAIFITPVALVFLDSSKQFGNISVHLLNTIGMLIELVLNGMTVRLDHMPYMLTWALIYIIFIVGMVASGTLEAWPYFFLETSSTASYIQYFGVSIGLVVFYTIFWILSLIKVAFSPELTMFSRPTDEPQSRNALGIDSEANIGYDHKSQDTRTYARAF